MKYTRLAGTPNLTEKRAFEWAQLGYAISAHCLTQHKSRISLRYWVPFQYTRVQIAGLESLRFLVLEDIADLFQVGLARESQLTWTLRDWDRAIRNRLGWPIEGYKTDRALILARHGFKLKKAADGGWWIQQNYGHKRYYRYRSSAIRWANQQLAKETEQEQESWA